MTRKIAVPTQNGADDEAYSTILMILKLNYDKDFDGFRMKFFTQFFARNLTDILRKLYNSLYE